MLDDLDEKLDIAVRFAAMAQDELRRCERLAATGGLVVPAYHVVWSTRGLTAGYCAYPCRRHKDHELRFNAHIAAHEGEGFRNTVAHELAHAIAGHAAAHGMDWQIVMYALGHTPTRCHSYTSARRANNRSTF